MVADAFTEKFSLFFLAINTQGTTFLAILLLALLILSFIISGSEVALFSLGSKDVNMLKTKQHASARRIVDLLDESKEVYTSLLIAGTFTNICIIVLANFLIDQIFSFDRAFAGLGSWSFISILVIKVLMIAFLLIFFCKVLPKIYATQNNLRFAYDFSYLIEGVHLFLRKVSIRMVRLADAIGKRLGANKSRSSSLQELDHAIDIGTDEETSAEEKSILKGIVKFGGITVKQIMRSRLDVSGIDYNTSFHDVIRKVEELHYSRLPVYRNSLDEVVGVVNTKDFIPHLDQPADFDWHTLMRQPFFVPETKMIEDLLRNFQARKTHFAVVVDEFGGTSGIVTMEDVLEEIIGDIRDEFDEEELNLNKIDDNNYVFEGKTMIHDVCRIMKLPLDTFDKVRGESESVGGLVLELAGEFPGANAVIPSGDFEFTVMETYKNRIIKVKITINRK